MINRPIYIAHIEGFPYLWCSRIPSNWDASTLGVWTLVNGLLMGTGDIEHKVCHTGGVEDVSSYEIAIVDDTYLLPLLASHRNISNDLAPLGAPIAAGENPNTLSLEYPITSAPATGTVYCCNSTITYTGISGDTLTGCVRGRYASVDTDLTELTWKPAISWDTTTLPVEEAPLVARYPRYMNGRLLTILRFEENLDGTVDVPSTTAGTIISRGRIQTIGLAEDGIAIAINHESLMALLDAEVLARQPEALLDGICASATAGETCYLYLAVEETMMDVDTLSDAYGHILDDFTTQWFTKKFSSYISLTAPYTLQGLVDGLNAFFKNARNTANVWGHYRAAIGDDGKVSIIQEPTIYQHFHSNPGVSANWEGGQLAGTDNLVLLRQGYMNEAVAQAHNNATGKYMFPKAILKMDEIAHQLGLCKEKKYLEIDMLGKVGPAQLKRMAVKYSGFSWLYTYYASTNQYWTWLPTGSADAGTDIRYTGTEPAYDIWASLDYSKFLNLDSSAGFVTNPGDDGAALVLVNDKHIVRFAFVGTTWLVLTDPSADWNKATRIAGDLDNPVISSTTLEDDPIVVKQVWRPTGKQGTEIGFENTLLQMLTSTGTAAYNGAYDVLPYGWGLQIPYWLIDTDSFLRVADFIPSAGRKRNLVLTSPKSMRDILDWEMQISGCYCCIKNGKIALVIPDATSASAVTLDDSMRIKGSLSQWQSAPEGPITRITLRANHDPLTDIWGIVEHYVDTGAQADWGIGQSQTIENPGICFSSDLGDDTREAISYQIADRLQDFSRPSYMYTAQVCGNAKQLSIGDSVSVTDSLAFNPITGTRGITGHIGTVVETIWNELGNSGEIIVRLCYRGEDMVQLGVTSIATWSGASHAPAGLVQIMEGCCFEYDGVAFDGGQLLWVPDVGTKVNVQCANDGLLDTVTITSITQISPSKVRVEVDRPVIANLSTSPMITITPASYLVQETEETLKHAHIAPDDGITNTFKGYRMIR